MPVLYKPFQSVLADKNGNKLFYPRIVLKGSVSTDQIAQEIADYSSLTKGDTKNVIDNLVKVLTTHLHASESVTLDGFGSFHLVMKSGGKGVLTAEEVSPAQSSVTVRFQPASTRNADRTVATRALVTGVKFVAYDTASATTSSGSSGSDSGSTDSGDEEEVNPFG